MLVLPTNTQAMSLQPIARAQTAPSAARVVGNRLWFRQIPNNLSFGGPPLGWRRLQLNNMTMPSGATLFQYKPQQRVPYSGIGGFSPGISPGNMVQFELSRVAPTSPSASNLSGDWNMACLIVEFS
jgi:hypothetical protein